MARKIETPHIKYVYSDVVGFAKGRSVEAQADIVQDLNDATLETLGELQIESKSRILLPSGDGICVALIQPRDYDIHLRFALELLRRVGLSNPSAKDQTRTFSIRVGINENTDNIIRDINGRRNIAGAGINLAQRIMDHADGKQILVGHTVHDVLISREKYSNAFRKYSATDKHNQPFSLFQYIIEGPGVSIAPPSRLEAKKEDATEPELSGYIAFFIAHATRNREFLERIMRESSNDYAALVALHYLTADSLERARGSKYEEPTLRSFGGGKKSFLETWTYYGKQDWWLVADFAEQIISKNLKNFFSHFESGSLGRLWIIPKHESVGKLKSKFPKWWEKVESGSEPI